MRLTETNIAKHCRLEDGETDRIFMDDDVMGFGLRIRAGGSRKYIVQYRQGGRQWRHTLGRVGVLTPEEARHRARKILVDVGDGKDPNAEKKAKQAAAGLYAAGAPGDDDAGIAWRGHSAPPSSRRVWRCQIRLAQLQPAFVGQPIASLA